VGPGALALDVLCDRPAQRSPNPPSRPVNRARLQVLLVRRDDETGRTASNLKTITRERIS
jgi:hypothetical protein